MYSTAKPLGSLDSGIWRTNKGPIMIRLFANPSKALTQTLTCEYRSRVQSVASLLVDEFEHSKQHDILKPQVRWL